MSRRNPKQKQLAVALPDTLRGALEYHAAQNGRSIAEEIRRRLRDSLVEDQIDEPLKSFRMEMTALANLAGTQTRQDFRTHPGANAVLRYAINARLARTRAEGEEKFAPGELPKNRVVAPDSDDPKIIGVAMETFLQAHLDHRDKNIKSLWLGTTAQIIDEKEEENSDGT
jgi:plasmid stability protein